MSSNDLDNMGPSLPGRVILLDLPQFEAIFQVVHQLPNFHPSRLADQGCTPADLDYLIAVVGSIQGILEGASRVRIIDSAEEAEGLSPTQASLVEVQEGGRSVIEVQTIVPQRISALWQRLSEFVASSLGSRELALRTGYGQEEIRGAIGALYGSR